MTIQLSIFAMTYMNGVMEMKETAGLFKILSVDKRIEIIELLKQEPISVGAIAESLGITQSAVSQHLRILKGADLVEDQRRGYWIYYALNRDTLEKCRQRLNRICTCGCLDPNVKAKKAMSNKK